MNKIKRKVMGKLLDIKQKNVNKTFEREGPTEFVMDRQVRLNQKRNELNIPDPNEFVNEEYVQ